MVACHLSVFSRHHLPATRGLTDAVHTMHGLYVGDVISGARLHTMHGLYVGDVVSGARRVPGLNSFVCGSWWGHRQKNRRLVHFCCVAPPQTFHETQNATSQGQECRRHNQQQRPLETTTCQCCCAKRAPTALCLAVTSFLCCWPRATSVTSLGCTTGITGARHVTPPRALATGCGAVAPGSKGPNLQQ